MSAGTSQSLFLGSVTRAPNSLKDVCNRAVAASRGNPPRSLGPRTYGYGSVGRCGRTRDLLATSRFRYDVQTVRCSSSFREKSGPNLAERRVV